VECFGGWGKGEPGEARGRGGQQGGGGTGREGPGGGGPARAGGSSTGALCTEFTLVCHKVFLVSTLMQCFPRELKLNPKKDIVLLNGRHGNREH
jgi:hypothetical protein